MTAQSQETMPVRQILVDFDSGFPRYWNADDAYLSHLYNALSLQFPKGEQYFIDTVREFVPALEASQQQKLLHDTKDFVGQEVTHRRIHSLYNEEIAKQGYTNKLEARIDRRIAQLEKFSALDRLAVVAAYEHYTAVLGDGVLRYREWTESMYEPLQTVWRWHAAEESEHKSVVFDVYRWAGGGYIRRIIWFMYVTFHFFLDTSIQTNDMLRQDGKLYKSRTWRSALKLWLGSGGWVWRLTPKLLTYFKPRFHPWQQDNHDLLEAWKNEYEGAYRVVRDSSKVALAS